MSRDPRGRFQIALATIFFTLFAVPTTRAQMQLPGATNGMAGGATGSSAPAASPAAEPAAARPVALTPPSEETIIGHPLGLDGAKGTMTFDRAGATIVLSKLTLVGDKISKAGQACSVDVSMASPVVIAAEGHPAGASRFKVPVVACPFSIDVLDGAVLVSRPEPSCDFVAADCRITPVGLWGPAAADLGPKRVKDLEHQRVRIETTMRANFHALLKQAGKDRAKVKAIAKEQAAFSSDREMTCRDYSHESEHGFCSTQITEARALALLARFGATPPEARHAHRVRRNSAVASPPPEEASPPAEK